MNNPVSSTKQVQIRKAGAADLKKIVEMHGGTFSLKPLMAQPELQKKVKILPGDLEVFVALQRGQIVGFVECTKNSAKDGWVMNIEVAKNLRGRGIGHRLLGKAHSFLMKRGATNFQVASEITKSAVGQYYSAGYKPIRVIPAEKGSYLHMARKTPALKRK